MLNQKYFGLQLWVWIVILGMILYLALNNSMLKSKNNETFVQEQLPSETKSKIKIFNFNTSWCGWSKKFQPEWDKFMESVKNLNNVQAIDVKCDQTDNESICEKYQVPGYPYIVFEVNGKVEPYDNERTSEGLMKHLKNYL
jgi:thiol-disulfide isomerase/thioredoxin